MKLYFILIIVLFASCVSHKKSQIELITVIRVIPEFNKENINEGITYDTTVSKFFYSDNQVLLLLPFNKDSLDKKGNTFSTILFDTIFFESTKNKGVFISHEDGILHYNINIDSIYKHYFGNLHLFENIKNENFLQYYNIKKQNEIIEKYLIKKEPENLKIKDTCILTYSQNLNNLGFTFSKELDKKYNQYKVTRFEIKFSEDVNKKMHIPSNQSSIIYYMEKTITYNKDEMLNCFKSFNVRAVNILN
jgi:hypothetical protein